MSPKVTITPLRAILFLMLAGFAWRGIFMYRSVDWLTNYWLFEDFGYSLKIARNIAAGAGETFDGVVRTSGYQPLYVWLMVPVFWILPKSLFAPIYVAETLLAIANLATGLFLYDIVRRISNSKWCAVVCVAFWVFNLAVARTGTLGLETGLSTMLVAAAIAYAISIEHRSRSTNRAFCLGGLLAVAFLGRVDAVFLVASTSLFFMIGGDQGFKQRAGFVLKFVAAFSALIAPYCIWNLLRFHSILPTSGQVTMKRTSLFSLAGGIDADLLHAIRQGAFITGHMLAGITTVNGWVPDPSAGPTWIAPLTVVLIIAAICISLFAYRGQRASLIFLAVTMLLYFSGYTVYAAHSFLAYERYFLTAMMISLIFLCVACYAVALKGARPTPQRSAVAALFCVIPFACFAFNARAKLMNEETEMFGWYRGAQVLNRIASPGDVVAAWQSGNTGYFYTQGRAVNLDGVVNTDAHRATLDGTLDNYIDSVHARYIADQDGWTFYVADQISDPHRREQFLCRMHQVFATTDYMYSIYELRKPCLDALKATDAPGWRRVDKPYAMSGYMQTTDIPGATLQIESAKGLSLRFLRHDWSGIVQIDQDGKPIRKVDLYSGAPDSTFSVDVPGDGTKHAYSIIATGEKNPLSHAAQVWFDAALEY